MKLLSPHFLRSAGTVATLAVLISCGGSGPGTGTSGSTSGSTGGSTGGSCNSTTYTPNYVGARGLTLRKWNALPIRVFFETNTPRGATTIEELCRRGFDDWEDAFGTNLWTEVTDAAFADMVVRVRTVSPQATLGITTVYFQTGSNIIQEAEMEIYVWASLPAASIPGTAAHEMGHGLGIGGHSPSNLDLMFTSGNATDLLTNADLNTMRTAYCQFAPQRPQTGGSSPRGPKIPRDQLQKEVIVCNGH